MKKNLWKVIGAVAIVLSVTVLVMMFAGLGTTVSRLVLTVMATASIIATVMLMPKQETPAPTPVAAPVPVATPASAETPAPVAAPATVSHDDVVSMIGELTRYYSGKSATIADEVAYLQATNDLTDTLQKTSALYVQAQQKRKAAERKAEAINQLLNGGNQNP